MSYSFASGQADEFSMSEAQHNSLLVRAALPSDAAALATLARQLLVYEHSLKESLGELTPWAASTEEVRKQILQAHQRFFIAERDGELLGYVKAVIHGPPLKPSEIGLARWFKAAVERAAQRAFSWMMRRPRPSLELTRGYIAGAFVREDARRTRVGQALVEAAERWFRVQGLATSELHVLYTNESGRLFWEEIGYQPLVMGMRKKL